MDAVIAGRTLGQGRFPIHAWSHTLVRRDFAEVHYLCAPGQTRRAVERAIRAVSAEQWIVIGEAPA